VMRMLGVPDPRRCHGFAASPARRERRWPYVCNCSRHELSTTRHNRIRNGSSGYRCRQCGSTLRPRPATDDG
jgi:SprT protein